MWSLCALQLYESKALAAGLKHLNSINFERLDNNIQYEEFLKLLDIYNALKFEAPKNLNLQITNTGLKQGLEGHDMYLSLRY